MWVDYWGVGGSKGMLAPLSQIIGGGGGAWPPYSPPHPLPTPMLYRYWIVERHELDNKFTKFHISLNLSIRGYSCDSWSVWNRAISELI